MNQIADQAASFANSASGSMEYAIETVDLQRVYRRGAEAVYALRGVDLAIAPGRFIALKGRSGSGKTTLLNCISGLDQPTSGIARVFGQEIGSWSEARRTTWRRQQVGFIFQSLGLLPVMSAFENVELALRLVNTPAKARQQATTETIDLVGLTKWSDHRPYELSGGQQQRVAIARALVCQPPLVIADEPTANLDTKTAREVLNLFRTIVRERNTTLLMATHDTLAEEYVDHIIYLSDGSVVDALE
jgi:ABC-type lipoprotein export system ATPase subunit